MTDGPVDGRADAERAATAKDKSGKQRRGRRVPAGHEPHPEEIKALLGWLDDLPPKERYLSASDLEGLYWVAVMKLHEIRAVAIAELYAQGNSYGRQAHWFGVTRGWIQKMVARGKAAVGGDLSKFELRSETPPPPPVAPGEVILPAVLRWRLAEAARKSDTQYNAAALAAIEAYLDVLENQSPAVTPDENADPP